jgi:hypothetical protein
VLAEVRNVGESRTFRLGLRLRGGRREVAVKYGLERVGELVQRSHKSRGRMDRRLEVGERVDEMAEERDVVVKRDEMEEGVVGVELGRRRVEG